jgi:hypothetical protein
MQMVIRGTEKKNKSNNLGLVKSFTSSYANNQFHLPVIRFHIFGLVSISRPGEVAQLVALTQEQTIFSFICPVIELRRHSIVLRFL